MPNALMVPEVHLMLSIAQREINNKNSVTILTCGGGKNFACSKNIYGIKAICKSCLFQQDNLVKKLNGKFVLKKISDQQKINSKVNIKKIKNYKYKNTNLGLAAFSSYTNTSRDTYLKGAIAQNSINKLVDTSITILLYFEKLLKKNYYSKIFVFNSRMSEKRCLLDYSINKNINIRNIEKLTTEKFYDFGKKLSQDRNFLKKNILKFKKKKKNYNFKKEKKFYSNKLNSSADPLNPDVYSSRQTKNSLPKLWNVKNNNIIFFTASDDEYQSFGKDFNPQFLSDQKSIIKKTCEIIKDNNKYFLWIRIHPRLEDVKWVDFDFYKSIEKKYKNVGVIYPNDKVSSYALILNANKVICYWSLLIAESAYWRQKKTISLTKNDMEAIGLGVTPKNIKDYKNQILNRDVFDMRLRHRALMYVNFFLNAGIKIKYFSGNIHDGYKFNKQKINLNTKSFLLYYFGKIYENFLNKYIN